MEKLLAQINIAQTKAPLDSEIMFGFTSRIDEINNLAEQAEGFIWRLVTADDDSENVFDNPEIVINMSVWRDLESLKQFVYRSSHLELLRKKSDWFTPIKTAHQALWWIPKDHRPTLEEGKQKLDLLNKMGPTQEAFTFATERQFIRKN